MKEDELLSLIRDHVRAEREEHDSLEKIARGEVSAEEIAELEQLAQSDASIATGLAAAKPLDDDAVERISMRVTKERPRASGISRAPASVVPLWRRAAVIVGPLAMAAAVLLYVTMRAPGGDLPGYQISASAEQTMRGSTETSGALVLSGASGATFTILARPDTAAASVVTAQVFAVRGDDVRKVEGVAVETAEAGSARITGGTSSLDGASEVRVVLSAKALDEATAQARAKEMRSDAGVRVLRVAIVRR